MRAPFVKGNPRAQERVDLDNIRVGKDVIEIVTSGMYVSPITIYREYIQNSADSIDAARENGVLPSRKNGKVEIVFDQPARSVTIRDNGAGIAAHDAVSTLVAIGSSPKRGSLARGFRGVGRLSGLAYCRELQFRTKSHSDKKVTVVSWDCRALRERLSDKAFTGDVRQIISDAVSVWREEGRDGEHFFEVSLKDISRLRSDLLLNERLIGNYLAQVAPVPFSSDFSFGGRIEKYLSAYSYRAPVDLTVAGERICRPYRDETIFPGTAHKLRIQDIEFIDFANVDGVPGASAWIAQHEYVRSIPRTLGIRGLRARVGNLQVGDSGLFDEIFKEARFNGWSIGEIHVHDPRIVPNARRDNFEVNHHYYNALVQLGPVAAKISHQCRSASVARNAEQVARNVIAEVEGRLSQKRSCDRAELSRLKSLVLRAKGKLKHVSAKERERLERKLNQLQSKLAKISPKRGAPAVGLKEATSLVSKLVKNREQAQRLIEALQRLC